MTDKKIDLSSLSNFELGPNWETIPKKVNNEFNEVKTERKNLRGRNKKKDFIKSLYEIGITYDNSAISKIKDKIRKSSITYSIEDITNTIISTKDRLSFRFEKLNKESFSEVILDNKIFCSRDEAINYIIFYRLDSLIEVTGVEEQNATGSYNDVLKCPVSDKLLPPKNYHNFENCICQHMYENKIKQKYEDFVKTLSSTTDHELVNKWKDTPLKKFTYEFKNDFYKGKKYDSIKLLINEIKLSYNKFVKERKKIIISGVEIDRLDKLLRKEIKDFYDKNHKWKKDLFFNVIINLKKSGFHIFKDGVNRILFACPVKPKKFIKKELSKRCLDIIEVIRQKVKISKKDLLNYDFNKNISRDNILYELKWLLKEGYIKEFKNGQLSIN
jgi:hypothetical protein